jgi:hypothetical protein
MVLSPVGFWRLSRERWPGKRILLDTRRQGAALQPYLAADSEALATPGAVIEARIAGTAKDGGPACATVGLLDGGWRVVRLRSTDDAPESLR